MLNLFILNFFSRLYNDFFVVVLKFYIFISKLKTGHEVIDIYESKSSKNENNAIETSECESMRGLQS